MSASEEEAPAERSEIRKGYEVEPGSFVILEDQELDALKPKESRRIEITRFLPAPAITHEWYERPYFLMPEQKPAPYLAFVEALRKRNVQGVARWVMRGRSHVGAIRAEENHLFLIKLKYAQEVLPASDLPKPEGMTFEPRELRMAQELVSALKGDFQPDAFHDEYRKSLVEFIEAKAKGEKPRLPMVKARQKEASLETQLEKSLAALKKGGTRVA
jgi:DNA end-binding protein Ku